MEKNFQEQIEILQREKAQVSNFSKSIILKKEAIKNLIDISQIYIIK